MALSSRLSLIHRETGACVTHSPFWGPRFPGLRMSLGPADFKGPAAGPSLREARASRLFSPELLLWGGVPPHPVQGSSKQVQP